MFNVCVPALGPGGPPPEAAPPAPATQGAEVSMATPPLCRFQARKRKKVVISKGFILIFKRTQKLFNLKQIK